MTADDFDLAAVADVTLLEVARNTPDANHAELVRALMSVARDFAQRGEPLPAVLVGDLCDARDNEAIRISPELRSECCEVLANAMFMN